MNQQINPLGILLNRSMMITGIVFMVGSMIIINTYFQNLPLKELFCCWLLVFINAYIGTFIANRAVNSDSSGFLVWGMLINGVRIGIFLIILLVIIKMNVVDKHAFAANTVLGYLIFLAREIYSLHTQSLRVYQNESKK